MTNNMVVPDTVTICNMALRHLGQTSGIVDFDNDPSEAANACRIFFPQVIDEVMGNFAWPFATKFASPALVQGPPTAMATPEWPYSYRVPDDCLFVRRILPIGTPITISIAGFPIVQQSYGGRFETQESRVKFRTVRDDQGMLILTDFPLSPAVPATASSMATPQLPVIEYVMQQDAEQFYPALFAQAVAAKLAFYMAPGITQGDRFKLGDRAWAIYTRTLSEAQSKSMNEQQPDMPVDSEFIRARD